MMDPNAEKMIHQHETFIGSAWNLMMFVSRTNERLALGREARAIILNGWSQKDDKSTPSHIAKIIQDIRRTDESEAEHPRLVIEMAFVHLIAAFDAFLSEYVTTVFIARPESLRSKKQITVEQALELSKTGSLVEFLASQEAHELAYKSFNDQTEFMKSKFGVPLLPQSCNLPLLSESIAIRNLLMHNRGIVNSLFLGRVPNSPWLLGEHVTIDTAYLERSSHEFLRFTGLLTRDFLVRFMHFTPEEMEAVMMRIAKVLVMGTTREPMRD